MIGLCTAPRRVNAIEDGDAVFDLAGGRDVVNADVAFLAGPGAGDHQLAVGREHQAVSALGPGAEAAECNLLLLLVDEHVTVGIGVGPPGHELPHGGRVRDPLPLRHRALSYSAVIRPNLTLRRIWCSGVA